MSQGWKLPAVRMKYWQTRGDLKFSLAKSGSNSTIDRGVFHAFSAAPDDLTLCCPDAFNSERRRLQNPSCLICLDIYFKTTTCMVVSQHRGTPKSLIYRWNFHYKPSILGYTKFRETPKVVVSCPCLSCPALPIRPRFFLGKLSQPDAEPRSSHDIIPQNVGKEEPQSQFHIVI